MSKSTWTGAVSSDWNDPDNWSPAGVPGASSDVTIATGRAVATFLDNSRQLRVDRKGGAGGTILNIGGTLTNSGSLRIGR
jgi:hypothetical protein